MSVHSYIRTEVGGELREEEGEKGISENSIVRKKAYNETVTQAPCTFTSAGDQYMINTCIVCVQNKS